MKKTLEIVLTLLLLCIIQSSNFAQTPNYTGTWILNFGKSKLEHKANGLTGSVFVINQEDNKFKLTRSHIFGEKKKKLSFKMTADGQTRRVKLLFRGKLEQKESSLQSTLWRKDFLNIVIYKFGADHNEFIADEVFKGRPQDHHNVWVFNRQMPVW